MHNDISERIIQKNKNLRTVVNKLDNIDNEFRFFKMEVLAGDPDYIVELVSLSSLPSTDEVWNRVFQITEQWPVVAIRANQIVAFGSISLRCIGIPDSIRNMIVL